MTGLNLRVYGGQLKLFRARKVDAAAYSCHATNKVCVVKTYDFIHKQNRTLKNEISPEKDFE